MDERETIKALFRDLGSLESVARVLDIDPRVLRLRLDGRDGRHRASPWKNRKRGPAPASWGRPGRARGERCSKGHVFTGENTIERGNGSRACRACHQDAVRRYDAKRGPRMRPYQRRTNHAGRP